MNYVKIIDSYFLENLQVEINKKLKKINDDGNNLIDIKYNSIRENNGDILFSAMVIYKDFRRRGMNSPRIPRITD